MLNYRTYNLNPITEIGIFMSTTKKLSREPRIEIVRVDPELAQQYLEKNTKNRLVTRRNVEQLANEMKENRWLFNGEPIRFDWNDVLMDGQHRLLSIVKSGVAQDILVIWNLDPAALYITDVGIKRSFANALTLEKHVNASAKASLTGLVWEWDGGARGPAITHFNSNVRPQIPELMQFFESHEEEICNSVRKGNTLSKHVPVSRRIAGLGHLLTARVDSKDADIFLEALQTGADLSVHSPILRLRNRYILAERRAEGTNTNGQLEPSYALALYIKAWNFWREGVEPTSLQYNPTSSRMETFPEPR
jgi:hypothetical protein